MATSGRLDSNELARKRAHRFRRWHHGVSMSLMLALSTFTWVMWLRDRETEQHRFASEIFALNVLWWIAFSNDAASMLADFVVGMVESFFNAPPLYTGANSHSTGMLANSARIGVSMTMAVGLLTRWDHYFSVHKNERTEGMFEDALNGSEAILLLGSMASIIHFGAIFYHFIVSSQQLREKRQ